MNIPALDRHQCQLLMASVAPAFVVVMAEVLAAVEPFPIPAGCS
ncbi:hypothetical protein SynBIOSE41_01557 [Synechococcus sp. BIOS-E4-1]|nr:hypothetical protein [Synechococcus sp. BIOS-E4-1]QNI54072.1 hypothetical protein SynBIOSE41_01557 [Synechococcus sp. BIOS-E4-1]